MVAAVILISRDSASFELVSQQCLAKLVFSPDVRFTTKFFDAIFRQLVRELRLIDCAPVYLNGQDLCPVRPLPDLRDVISNVGRGTASGECENENTECGVSHHKTLHIGWSVSYVTA